MFHVVIIYVRRLNLYKKKILTFFLLVTGPSDNGVKDLRSGFIMLS